jgi:hypothetical protein
MKELGKKISLLLAVFLVLGVVFALKTTATPASNGNQGSNSNFEEFHAPLVKCSDTTMLCGLDSNSPMLGTDPLKTSENSRARIQKHGDLVITVDGAEPNTTYDVSLIYTPGGTPDCSGVTFDPTQCSADCTTTPPTINNCSFATCTADCTTTPPTLSCTFNSSNCTVALTLSSALGSFNTDNKGRGKFATNVSNLLNFSTTGVDSVQVLITRDIDGTTTSEFITGAKVR